jgi:hypothetical protein
METLSEMGRKSPQRMVGWLNFGASVGTSEEREAAF